MKPQRYIVWSTDTIDLDDPYQKKWYYQQVLTKGRTEDIQELDWEEIRELLPELNLPHEVRRLWEKYFND